MTAATSQQYPVINGIAPSWADIQTTYNIDGGGTFQNIDYSAINAESTVEVGYQRGASGGRIMKRTTGQLSHTASATFYMSGLRELKKQAMDIAPTRGQQRLISLVHFNIQVLWTAPGDATIHERVIRGARLTKDAWGSTEGTDADKVEVDLNPAEVIELIDGVEVVLL